MNKNFLETLGALLLAVATVALMMLITGLITKLLWNNCLIPAVNGINEITFWQAMGLNILFGTLIRSTTLNKTKEKK